MSDHVIDVTVNHQAYRTTVEARDCLSDVLRDKIGCTGVHVGCEQGVCGACTVLLDGVPVRSCLVLAVQAEGSEVLTVESLGGPDGKLHKVQEAMREAYGLQCGFCTPGILMTLAAMTDGERPAGVDEMVAGMSGHLCRCTGYQGIRRAIGKLAADGDEA